MLNGAWRSLFQIFRLPLLTTMLKQQSKQHGDPNPTENSRSDYSVINKTFVFLIKGIIPCPLVPHHKFPTSILDRCLHFSTLGLRWKWAKRSKRAFFFVNKKKEESSVHCFACVYKPSRVTLCMLQVMTAFSNLSGNSIPNSSYNYHV